MVPRDLSCGDLKNGTGESMNRRQKGFSLIELLIVVAIILIIASIAIPSLTKSRMQANEAAAVVTLGTLNSTAVMYSTTYGSFPHALSDMGPSGGSTNSTSAAADLVDSTLASGVKGGYKFTFTPTAADTVGHVLGYSITATPVVPGTTGQRAFFTDQGGTIRASPSGTADSSSPPIG
jgi:type IV pilus assembly protein PilA